MTLKTYQLTHFEAITDNISLVTLEPEKDPIMFEAGQYVLFHLPSGEKAPFSMANHHAHHLEFHIRHGSHNPVADLFLKTLLETKRMDLSGPYGHCILPEVAQPLIFVAGGTGIASHKPLIDEALDKGFPSVKLYWGIKSPKDLYLSQWLEENLKNPRFEFHPVLSKAHPEWKGMQGFVHEILLECESVTNTLVYASGPYPMIQALTQAYKALDLSIGRLLSDML